MLVPDHIRENVAYVGYQMADGRYLVNGTVFFVGRDIPDTEFIFVYAITAKHVIEDIRRKGLDRVFLRLNIVFGVPAKWIETKLEDWIFHPDDLSIDVAVIPISFKWPVQQRVYRVTRFATYDVMLQEGIGLGDEVFIVGLFSNHYGSRRNIPIIRVGNIAALPEEPIATVPPFDQIVAYLIEARSTGGLSGSPVFVHPGLVRLKGERVIVADTEPMFYLLGLIHGHFDEQLSDPDIVVEDRTSTGRVNTGIAMVVPAPMILDVLNQPLLQKREEEARRQIIERTKAAVSANNDKPTDISIADAAKDTEHREG